MSQFVHDLPRVMPLLPQPEYVDLSPFTPKREWETKFEGIFNQWLSSFLQTVDKESYNVLFTDARDFSVKNLLALSSTVMDRLATTKEHRKERKMVKVVIILQLIFEVMMGNVPQIWNEDDSDEFEECQIELLKSIHDYLSDEDLGYCYHLDGYTYSVLDKLFEPFFVSWRRILDLQTDYNGCCVLAKSPKDFSQYYGLRLDDHSICQVDDEDDACKKRKEEYLTRKKLKVKHLTRNKVKVIKENLRGIVRVMGRYRHKKNFPACCIRLCIASVRYYYAEDYDSICCDCEENKCIGDVPYLH